MTARGQWGHGGYAAGGKSVDELGPPPAEREGTVPAPSDEAVEAAARTAFNVTSDMTGPMADGYRSTTRQVLAAAYAIDMPRREAEVRAEAIREVIAWLRRPQGMGGDSIRRMGDANALAQKFGIDGDVAL